LEVAELLCFARIRADKEPNCCQPNQPVSTTWYFAGMSKADKYVREDLMKKYFE